MTKEEIMALSAEQLKERMSAIKTEMNKEDADIEALSAEVDAIEERRAVLKKETENRNALAQRIANGAGRKVEGATGTSDAEKRAQEFVKTGKMETRALLSTGKIAKPVKVDGINGLADIPLDIVDDVHAVALAGNGSYTAAYKKSRGTAVDVTDGEAIGGTQSEFDYVTINPAEWGTYGEISNQVKKMTPLDYQGEIERDALISLRVVASAKIVAAVKASALVGKRTVAIDANYLRTLVLGRRNIAGKGDTKLYLSAGDLLALGKVRGTNEKKPLYDIAFDAGSVTSGTITEGGMAVRFSVSDDLTDGTQLFGQPQTIEMPMWDNYAIETNEGGELFKRNMMAYRGIQTANADVAAVNGMEIITNAGE